MAAVSSESSLNNHVDNEPSYIVDGDPGAFGGGTYTAPADPKRDPTIQDWEAIFGPAGRDVKFDLQRHKRHSRWHLPDVLKGPNPFLTDKIDGLITDTTTSPFTTKILPYFYIENVDAKIKWNRWNFDEGLASRVPYESAARTLTQSKTSYKGYTIRQGLAITMEHNFMMSQKGRENFKMQLQQIVGSIQYTNDIDVHFALIQAKSYAKERAEKFHSNSKTNHQIIREYIDLFGMMQKNPNALDILIEEAKATMRSWGADEPDFMLTNSKLTFQIQMLPEKTQYLTQGPDGAKRLRAGPNINSYRGLAIINSRSFSLEDGAPPRDVLRRRVRVAEYYRIPWEPGIEHKMFSFYDESKDCWNQFSWHQLYRMSECPDQKDFYDDEVDSFDPKTINTTLSDIYGPPPDSKIDPAIQKKWKNPNVQIEYETYHKNMTQDNAKPNAIAGLLAAAAPLTGGARTHDATAVLVGLTKFMTHKELEDLAKAKWGTDHKEFAEDFKNFLMGETTHMSRGKKEFFINLDWYDGPGVADYIDSVWNRIDKKKIQSPPEKRWELVIIRPNIEHQMLGVIIGKGGLSLGATLWGQTELSVHDDSMHGIWGMSYKYNERSIVFDHKLLIRLWDICYGGYNGGKDCTSVNWQDREDVDRFREHTYGLDKPYEGQSMMVMRFDNVNQADPWPSPIVFHDSPNEKQESTVFLDGEHQHMVRRNQLRVFNRGDYKDQYAKYYNLMPNFSRIHNPKNAGSASEENETSCNCLAFQGTMRIHEVDANKCTTGHFTEITGNGHHGPDRCGIASVRCGKGINMGSLADAALSRLL